MTSGTWVRPNPDGRPVPVPEMLTMVTRDGDDAGRTPTIPGFDDAHQATVGVDQFPIVEIAHHRPVTIREFQISGHDPLNAGRRPFGFPSLEVHARRRTQRGVRRTALRGCRQRHRMLRGPGPGVRL